MVGNRFRILSSNALTTFAQAVYVNRLRLRRVWIISPWLAAEESGVDPISLLIEGIKGTRCAVNLVTRKPTQAWHLDALRFMCANFRPTVFYCPTLHTKLYLLECDGFRCAVMGSPNLTARAERANRELAIEFRTTVESREDEVAALITALSEYAQALTAEDDVKMIDIIRD